MHQNRNNNQLMYTAAENQPLLRFVDGRMVTQSAYYTFPFLSQRNSGGRGGFVTWRGLAVKEWGGWPTEDQVDLTSTAGHGTVHERSEWTTTRDQVASRCGKSDESNANSEEKSRCGALMNKLLPTRHATIRHALPASPHSLYQRPTVRV